jgi:mono/diheme cytochrome c family protein
MRFPLWVLAAALTFPALNRAADKKEEFAPEAIKFYENDVLPLLKAHCYNCHGNGKTKGNFNMTVRADILKGGDLGPAVDLKKLDESPFLNAINFKEGLEMPPKGKLKQTEIDILTKWIKAGLPMKDGQAVAKTEHKKGITDEDRNYWAYKGVKRPAVPATGAKNPIDAFIAAKWEGKKVTPAKLADPVALVRRLYYDLTGLPPTPQQVDSFVKDPSLANYEKLVDELLASPKYGEKWGRHWLDVVRYAETNGYERDGPKPYVWRYRDYVIRSFNSDKPFDLFIKEQLAGDEIDPNNPDAIIATGYYRLGTWDDEPADPEQALFDDFDDIVATTSQGFLGMTMNCARCHDHKIDPIPQADYYKFLSFFRDVRRYSNDRNTRSSNNLTDIAPKEVRAKYEEELNRRKGEIAELTKKMEAIENEAIKKMPAQDQRASEGNERPQVVRKVPKFLEEAKRKEYVKLREDRQALEKKPMPSQELALSVNNSHVKPPETMILIRGNAHAEGAVVAPSFPEVLGNPTATIPAPLKNAKSSGRRTVLANWIANTQNPLTARVMVNRIWQGHFGRGIVASSNDFGKLGSGATHPELLDWLAAEFMANGWKMKSLHKQILTSETYRRSAVASEDTLRNDPGNMLLANFPMRRLTAEEVRDSILDVSGQLNEKTGGPSVYPKIPKEVLAGQSVPGQGWNTSSKEDGNRRSIYVHVKRSLQVPVLSQHDQADTDTSCPVRYTTTVPTQALGMLNGEFSNEAAVEFAQRLQKEEPTIEARVRKAIRLTTGRAPGAEEVQKDLAFIEKLKTVSKLSDEKALIQYCLLILNTNEFVYLD